MKVVTHVRHLLSLLGAVGALKYLAARLLHLKEIRLRPRCCGTAMWMRPLDSDIWVLWHVFGRFECEVPEVVDPRVILDCGAYAGYSTTYFAQKHPAALVVAIEPDANNLDLLKRNCASLPNVQFLHGAIWGQSGEQLNPVNPNAQSFARQFARQTNLQSTSRSWVAGYTIKDLIMAYGLDEIDLIKFDIEGAEVNVFEHNPEAWLPRVRAFAIETHSSEGAELIAQVARSNGFVEHAVGEKHVYVRREDR